MAKYFDYLEEYGEALQNRLSLDNLSTKVAFWRKNGLDDPDGAVVECRKVIEKALTALIDDESATEGMRLVDMVGYVSDQGMIGNSLMLKIEEIRRLGNRGAHDSVKVVDAEMSMELRDDVLGASISLLGIDDWYEPVATVSEDVMFVALTQEESASLARRARTAALLSDDASVEKSIEVAMAEATKLTEAAEDRLHKMRDLLEKAAELNDESDLPDEIHALLERTDGNIRVPKACTGAAKEKIESAQRQVDEVLKEHDFIEKLLRGTGQATDDQLEVMAFPRTAGSSTSILQIAGGAGTGKTLCLLAKLIREVDPPQMDMFDGPSKKALFLCFNTNLKDYVRGLLKNYPGVEGKIVVDNFDRYVNQLAKPKPDGTDFEPYGNDVRYPGGFRIYYEKESPDEASLLAQAMDEVAALHPDQAGAYYLDSSVEDNLQWVNAELEWLEGRFEDARSANPGYLTIRRTGRGAQHLPNERIREVILEVWDTYRDLLDREGRYTIGQATRRLLDSASLPSFDAIAIDEVQDLSLRSIQLVLKFRASPSSRVYISGDENQKIYQRDFTWKELDSGIKGYTITLKKNMRNSYSIRNFAERMLGGQAGYEDACDGVSVIKANAYETVREVQRLVGDSAQETTVFIGNKWEAALRDMGLRQNKYENSKGGSRPGYYTLRYLKGKGLEFDNVVVDCSTMVGDDAEAEKRLRYVHFTRARKRLVVCYEGDPPELLREHYPDFL